MYGDGAASYGSQANVAWAKYAYPGLGTKDIVIGVIDEGVMWNHEDLSANIWINPGESGSGKETNGVDDDGNGYKDDVRGWDFDGNNNSTFDGVDDDHGTHVAGTIGAKGGNSIGVAGITWNVKLISAKFLGRNGGTLANAIKAVDYITDLKSRYSLNLPATNNSWGGGGFSQALKDAIDRAGAKEILFVAAAGNDGANNDATKSYPSGYESANVIAVASIVKDGTLSSFSNFGAATVDLGAPGSGIYSTLPKRSGSRAVSGYGSYSGTSMATPHVTGGAALYAATHTSASAANIKNAILSSAVQTASLTGKCVTGGRLNVSSF
jgi:subtilisin family serine protease